LCECAYERRVGGVRMALVVVHVGRAGEGE
jgi:hypothetical protein